MSDAEMKKINQISNDMGDKLKAGRRHSQPRKDHDTGSSGRARCSSGSTQMEVQRAVPRAARV
jgi:hypothetical protein